MTGGPSCLTHDTGHGSGHCDHSTRCVDVIAAGDDGSGHDDEVLTMNAYESTLTNDCIRHGLAALVLLAGCEPTLEREGWYGPPLEELQWRVLDDSPSHARLASLGAGTTCAATLSGDIKCWGRNDAGQAGQGHHSTLGDDETPRTFDFVDLLGEAAMEVHTNGAQTFVRLEDGAVHGWGVNASYELGLMHDASIGENEPPALAPVPTKVQLGNLAVQLAVGSDFACARLDDGALRCWGAGELGQLGLGSTSRIGDDEAPMELPAIDLGRPAVDLAAGATHACAVLDDGDVRCWGANDFGQLGLGHTENIGDDEPPSAVEPVDLEAPVTAIVAGGHHTCALLDTGAIRCWGLGGDGQLGLSTTDTVGDDEQPTDVHAVDVGAAAVELAAGWSHTCAVLVDGSLRCWGANDFGQLGLGHTETIGDDEGPGVAGAVDLGTREAVGVFSGPMSTSTCAVLDDGELRCWGANDEGQLGQGHTMVLGDEPNESGGDLPIIILIDDDDE